MDITDLHSENIDNPEEIQSTEISAQDDIQNIKSLTGLYENWFLDYASYVILERAVPYQYDGLKPVQRRILHSMKRMDDGRFNKVANIIGHTMQFHPHGDASIGDALVGLGQKDLLVETQGNWGNILTGDSAAAPRYIEARLSKFANEVIFNPKTTEWKSSYDGRNKEPVCLPVKFPLLLAMGVEGIAVGLASKVLPHNFIELIDASIAYLKGEEFELYPDFPTGGFADVSRYNDGLRGGKVRVRAKIQKQEKKALIITEIPFGTNTGSLIDSILQANEKGKIKIKKIDDNTAANVEIVVHLVPGSSPDITIDALYAFTDCEVSISPNSCVIIDDKPQFVGVSQILRMSTENTRALLTQELKIRLQELEDAWHLSSLEKIFIENKIYLRIEECETWEQILETIDQGLEPFKPLLRRIVTTEDIAKLTEIKIKRISRFDAFKADEYIKGLEAEMETVNHHLVHIIPYSIKYFENIRNKYSKGKERKTELRNFDVIEATKVVVANEKLYVNRETGFVGTGLKKEEFVCDCSDIDDVIVFLKDGKYVITKVSDKTFVGKNIVYVNIFKKNDSRTIYNVLYRDGETGFTMAKRFAVTGITRDKVYDVTRGTEHSRIVYFTANPNGEAETVRIMLRPKSRLKILNFDFEFASLAIKGRASQGNIVTRHAVHRIIFKEKGISTLGGSNIWFDPDVQRLNTDGRGTLLGEFSGANKILVVYKNSTYKIYSFELSNHFEDDILLIEKYDQNKVFTLVYFDGEEKYTYIKRFNFEITEKLTCFISEHPDSKLIHISGEKYPRFEVIFGGRYAQRPTEEVDIHTFIAVKGLKAKGKRLSTLDVASINELEPVEVDEPELFESEGENGDGETNDKGLYTDEFLTSDDIGDEGPEQMSLFD